MLGRRQQALSVERNPSLVLKAPQHYHVTVMAYRELAADGQTFQWSTAFELVANDVELAASRARALAREPKSHVGSVRQCSDPQHLEGTDTE